MDQYRIPGDVIGRIEECMNHAEAWLEAGDHERARHFLELALEVGFGVGYRKDYQMNLMDRLAGQGQRR